MKRTTVFLALGGWIFFVACSSEPPNDEEHDGCDVGRSLACACTDGSQGAQICGSDGTLGECVCEHGSGGNAGTGGSDIAGFGGASGSMLGGSTGLGGNQPSGGTATSGGTTAVGGTLGFSGTTGTGGTGVGGTGASSGTGGIGGGNSDNYLSVTVTYDGSITRTLSHVYSSTNLYTAMNGEGMILYQVEDGYTQVDFWIRPAATGGGYEVEFTVSDFNMSLPARIRGAYYETAASRPGSSVPLGSSCVTFDQLELGFGGVVSGTIDCTLAGGNDTTPVPATATGTFHAVFPQ